LAHIHTTLNVYDPNFQAAKRKESYPGTGTRTGKVCGPQKRSFFIQKLIRIALIKAMVPASNNIGATMPKRRYCLGRNATTISRGIFTIYNDQLRIKVTL